MCVGLSFAAEAAPIIGLVLPFPESGGNWQNVIADFGGEARTLDSPKCT